MFLTTTQSHLFIDCVYFQNFSIHVHNFIFCSQHSWYHTLFCSAICPRLGGSGGWIFLCGHIVFNCYRYAVVY